jgi:tetratricopeptide (TPR) repeat protein
MNNQHTFSELLDLWVNKELNLEELSLLSGKGDLEALQQETMLHKTAVLSIQKMAIAEQVASVHQKYLSTIKEPVKKEPRVFAINSRKIVLRVAAAAAIMIGVFISIDRLLINPEIIYKETFQNYYVNTERGIEDGGQSNIMNGYFLKNNTDGVIEVFTSMKNPDNKARFLAGYCFMQKENYDKAVQQFSQIINQRGSSSNGLFKDEAEYYLTLTYLKLHQYDKAYALMKNIRTNPEHTYTDAFDSWVLLRTKWLK